MKKLSLYALTAAALAAVASPGEVQGQFGAELDVVGTQILVGEPSRVLGPGVQCLLPSLVQLFEALAQWVLGHECQNLQRTGAGNRTGG